MKKMTSIRKINNPYFKLKVGTFDKKNPQTIFIEGSTYIVPDFDSGFGEALSILRKNINFSIKEELLFNSDFENKFIDVLEVPEERMRCGKKSYFYFECHLKQKGNKNFEEIVASSSKLNEKIINIIYSNILSSGFYIAKNR